MPGVCIRPGRLTAYLPEIFAPPLSCLTQLNRLNNRFNRLEKRWRTDQAGHEKSGHINAGPNEGIFFLDSMSSTRAQEKVPQSDLDI